MKTDSLGLVACHLLFVFATPPVVAATECFDEHTFDRVERFVEARFAESRYGVVIGLVDSGGSRVFSGGKLDNGTEETVDGDTVFEIGSITKTFVSLLLLEMVERGEVRLDDPVSEHMPPKVRVPTHSGKAISLGNLAAQDSGLPMNADNHVGNTWWAGFNSYTSEDLYAFLSRHKLQDAPGAQFRYSNVGFTLLGHALARRAGKDFESLVTSRICDPLGMHDTRITLSADQRRRRAVGHGEEGERAPYYEFQVMEPAGSLYSTGNDMLKYLSAQLGLVENGLTPLMEQSQVLLHEDSPNWGDTATPWFNRGVYEPKGSRLLGHGGGTVGFSTFIGMDVERRRGVVVLTSQRTLQGNRRVLVPAAVGWSILQGLPLTEWTSTNLVREAVGLGVELAADEETGCPKIARIFSGSPAHRAGLTEGEIINSINGIAVKGKSMPQCLELLGQASESTIRLEVAFAKSAEARVVELKKGKYLTIG